ncbi:MAG TPA: Na+/H+ antiporter NhaA [Actinomycetota bacterium]|nr:Na+/H+ antiporter NhaA [Actinomycetota bacterium]
MSRPGPPRRSWIRSERPVPRLIGRPLRAFLDTEAAGGIVLFAATIVALIWANSPASSSYDALWRTDFRIGIGGFELAQDFRHWINDGLMAIFFFVVGLEIKRELVRGELNEVRKATLPAFAAVGGMVIPALIYIGLNRGGPGASGWGIPMATDIAFAVGVLALLGKRVPSGLKILILSLAIVDDIGAILVIAVFYSQGISPEWLLVAAGLMIGMVVLRRLRILWVPLYVVIGTGVWLATFQSGVHATIAGVALGLLTPARATDEKGFQDVVEETSMLSSEPDAQSLRALSLQANEVVSVAERLEHLLHPWTSFLVIPLFALANAGLRLGQDDLVSAASSPVALGIAVGLVGGKLLGISAASWLAVRLNLGRLPDGVRWRHLLGGAAVAGIGFTVSLFIASLAFDEGTLVDQAKMGILFGSVIAGVLGASILARRPADKAE